MVASNPIASLLARALIRTRFSDKIINNDFPNCARGRHKDQAAGNSLRMHRHFGRVRPIVCSADRIAAVRDALCSQETQAGQRGPQGRDCRVPCLLTEIILA